MVRALPSEPEGPPESDDFSDDCPLASDADVFFLVTSEDLFDASPELRREEVLAEVDVDFLAPVREFSLWPRFSLATAFPFLALDLVSDPLPVAPAESLDVVAPAFLDEADVLGAPVEPPPPVSRETVSELSRSPFAPRVLSTACCSDSPAGELGINDPKPRPSPRLFSATVLLLDVLGC